ncbi:hypothetical protein [Actinoplanes rectilineatus]|uniref:hypothetical protein n=1 Tax=Actinoplanes rectilineatus TaxID=113571 RepID=UPI0006960B41|nr:hypothetical protein [Actinoplanes rectilineatus]
MVPPQPSPAPGAAVPPVKRAAPAKRAAPRKAAKKAVPEAAPAPPFLDTLARDLRNSPDRAPETLASAAVQQLGPRAAAWAARTRASYPRATPDALARLAVQRFARAAAVRGALGSFAGAYTPAALFASGVVTHAGLVLHLAAVYGLDATDPRRAEDLLACLHLDRRNLAGSAGAWAALRLTGRAFPGLTLLATAVTAHSTAEAVAVRAQRRFRAVRAYPK